MADDFEKALLYAFASPDAVDASTRQAARGALDSARQSGDLWPLCLSHLSSAHSPEVRFWVLQTLLDLIQSPERPRGPGAGVAVIEAGGGVEGPSPSRAPAPRSSYDCLSAPDRSQVKLALIQAGAEEEGGSSDKASSASLAASVHGAAAEPCAQGAGGSARAAPAFVRNKAAQALVAIARREFPAEWPGFFSDLLRVAGAGPGGAALLARTLAAVDEDVVSLDIPRSAEGARTSMSFKDAMREGGALAELREAWPKLLVRHLPSRPLLAVELLRALARFVGWADVSLVANAGAPPALSAALSSSEIEARAAAAELLAELAGKRMEAGAKLQLLRDLGLGPGGSLVLRWQSAGSGGEVDSMEPAAARLLAAASLETLEALRRVENGVMALEAAGVELDAEGVQDAAAACAAAEQALESFVPGMLRLLVAPDPELAAAPVPFFLAYVAWLRGQQRRARQGAGAGMDDGWGASGAEGSGEEILAALERPGAAAAKLERLTARDVLPLLDTAARAAQFPDDCALSAVLPTGAAPRAADEQEEEALAERREALFALFKNAARLAPARAAETARAALARGWVAEGDSWQAAELGAMLLFHLGEGGGPDAPERGSSHASRDAPASLGSAMDAATLSSGLITSSLNLGLGPGQASTWPALVQLARTLLHAPCAAAQHRLAALALLETLLRFARGMCGAAAGAAARPPAAVAGGEGQSLVRGAFCSSSLLPHQSPLPPPDAQQDLQALVEVFLGPRGLGHASPDVARRAAYLFCRLAKQLRGGLRALLDPVLGLLAPALAAIAASPCPPDASDGASRGPQGGGDERLYAFEAAGLLLGQEDVDPGAQAAWLQRLAGPLCAQLDAALATLGQAQAGDSSTLGRAGGSSALGQAGGPSAQAQAGGSSAAQARAYALASQALEGLTRTARGFPPRLCAARPALAAGLLACLQAAARALNLAACPVPLRSRVLALLHRGVESLSLPLVGPLLTQVLAGLLAQPPSPAGLSEILVLAGQVAARYGQEAGPLLLAALPRLLAALHAALGADWDWSGAPGSGAPAPLGAGKAGAPAPSEDARERLELQRAYHAFAAALAAAGLGPLVLDLPGPSREALLESLLGGGRAALDPGMRKTCVQALSRMCQDWLQRPDARVADFAVDRFAGQVCLAAALSGGVDPRDAASLGLFSETAAALCALHARLGAALEEHLRQRVLPTLGWAPEAQAALLQHLAAQAQRPLRELFRSVAREKWAAGRGR